MIDEIQVRDLALIREASLEPSSGLTVLTGETGAGKTALLSAMKLLMGERADKHVVRDGSEGLAVSGRFLDGEDELVVTRSVSREGRSRAKANGTMVSAGELSSLVTPRVDLCSQNEHQLLMKPASHVALLDAWIGEPVVEERAAYDQALAQAHAAQDELDRVLRARSEGSAALDEARFVMQRIDAVNPIPGEYEELSETLSRAEHAETLARAAFGAQEALAGEGGALDSLNAAIAFLQEGAHYDGALGGSAKQLIEASYVLEDVAREARSYGEHVDFDPEMLAYQQQRVADYQGLLRAYGPRMEDVFAAREHAADTVSLVDDAELREREARQALERAELHLAEAASSLSSVRRSHAAPFAKAVTLQMQRLEMGTAELEVSCEGLPRAQWTRAGSEAVEFLFRPGATMQTRPLARIASGGEVSRVMLALKVVLGSADAVDTLVFDEIDAGVGGSTANALAEVLADLALTHQVIVVTHLAQVAVRGDAHYVVEKAAGPDGIPETHIRKLSPGERPQEIARMLSGDITAASLAHAKELLGQH